MFRTVLGSLCIGGVLLSSPAEAAPIPPAEYKLNLEKYVLEASSYAFPSGLRIILQEERTQPIVAITSVIDRGSEHDQKGMDGIAHVVEHLAFRANHGGIKNWDIIKQMGGSINASTSVDWTNYMTIAPKDTLEALLRIEALRLKDGVANVTEQDVRTECEIARNELRMRYENAAVGAAWDEIGKALFPPKHAYARSTIGNHETLSNINLKAVQDFVRDNYKPEYTTIVVVGDFDKTEASNLIFSAFEGSEELLMAPSDAEKFSALSSPNERIKFFNSWVKGTLNPYIDESYKTPYPARVKCADRPEPPPPSQKKGDEIPKVTGMLDTPNLVVAWSLPGGYCQDQPSMNMAAFLLQNYILENLFPNLEARSKNRDKVGCFVSADEYASQMICFVEKKGPLAKYSYKKLAQEVRDSLYLQTRLYDPNDPRSKMKQMAFESSKIYGMASILQSVDSVSNLFSGRATAMAMYTHFTGDAQYFSSNLGTLNQVNSRTALEIAKKYITRQRMIAVVVEPMKEEDRLKNEQKAGKSSRSSEVKEYHATQDADRYTSLFKASEINKDLIEEQLVKPDLSKLRRFTLDNGLNVAILPYGDAPLVRVQYTMKGDPSNVEPRSGLDYYASSMFSSGASSKEDLMQIAGYMTVGPNSFSLSGSSGNLDAILNKLRWQFEDVKIDGGYYRNRFLQRRVSGAKWGAEKPEVWASRMSSETLFPDHVMGKWMRPSDWEEMKQVKPKELKQWVQTKMQPANSELVIVGKIDPSKAEELVRSYFESLAPAKDVKVGELDFAPKPTKTPERSIFVFDKPIASQTQVSMSCQIEATDHLRDRPKTNVVSETMSEMAWRRLREERGVTYGAYAYDRIYKGGTAMIGMQSLVQNDAVGLAVKSMLDIVDQASQGNVREEGISDAKIKFAREYVLGQQSGEQMLRRLSGVRIKNFDYFDEMADILAKVSKDDFAEVLKPCKGHEVFTLVGPAENASKLLDAEGIPHTVVPWQQKFEEQLSEKELKKYKKRQAKKEKAKKEKEEKEKDSK
ncbi:MAG: insulinase family protein [Myxococcota bacterium]|nr:insulinase family protein [Myxococcota bacterium]